MALGLTGCQLNNSSKPDSSPGKGLSTMSAAIYVQAAPGSFNHQAITQLYQNHSHEGPAFIFSGTPLKTFEQAWKNSAEAFVALRNDLISGHLVKATVEAIQEYRVIDVTDSISLPIEMCLLRTRKSVNQKQSLQVIISHPAALGQITQWKKGKNLEELQEPDGTSIAAKRLAEGKLSERTGAIGPCLLENLYPSLIVVEKGIQDSADNTTLFGQLKVEKREAPIPEDVARRELSEVIKKARAKAVKYRTLPFGLRE
ncbi:hypothetical protein [Endozoicomonas sp. Mp262]|uniref:prephenate dehydratase domain-containing protein n=1 Tax=Endozoicomonas sp. Mp262 TaxID=2919499 RepID=UPI0021D7E4F7